MKKLFIAGVMFMVVLIAGSAVAAEHWRDRFDRICGETSNASKMSPAELDRYIMETDLLIEELEQMCSPDNTKMFIFRLKKCRGFYQYNRNLRSMKTNLFQ